MSERISFDEMFMDICQTLTKRATCPRRQIGAVLVKDKHIIATGYNGAPKNFPHPLETGCLRDRLQIPHGVHLDVCPCLHAEQNAIIQAARFGIAVEGGTMYSSIQPCIQCARMIANVGIKRAVFKNGRMDDLALSLLKTAGVTIDLWSDETKTALLLVVATFQEEQERFQKEYLAKAETH